MREDIMRELNLLLKMLGAGALAFSFAGLPALAQSMTTQPPAPATTAKKKPTSATPQMIDEAVQRSQARSAKTKLDPTKPEQWGSEEPFTYIPGKTF
jgi:hypothetical protein